MVACTLTVRMLEPTRVYGCDCVRVSCAFNHPASLGMDRCPSAFVLALLVEAGMMTYVAKVEA